jgi:hypothetical protein
MIWGDDTVIAAPAEWLPDKADDFGFKTESVQGIAMFLSKNWLADGRSHTLVSRMYINSINKEERKEPDDPSIALLGCRVRLGLLKAHPQASVFEQAMRARKRTAAAYERSVSMSEAELHSSLLRFISERKLNAVALSQLQADLQEAGYSDTVVSHAIAEALGKTHAFGYWHQEVDTDITPTEAIATLVTLGQEAQ